jgi:hypothetical protein
MDTDEHLIALACKRLTLSVACIDRAGNALGRVEDREIAGKAELVGGGLSGVFSMFPTST